MYHEYQCIIKARYRWSLYLSVLHFILSTWHSDSPVHAWPLAFQFDVIYMQEVADGSSQSISETVLTSAEQQEDKT